MKSHLDNLYELITLMMEAVSTCETSVNFYEIALRNVSEGCHLQLVAMPTSLCY
jgi:hypothetical protein